MPADKQKYSLKHVMTLDMSEPIYAYPKGLWCWIKRKLGFKVAKVIVRYKSDLEHMADVIAQPNELIEIKPFYKGNYEARYGNVTEFRSTKKVWKKHG